MESIWKEPVIEMAQEKVSFVKKNSHIIVMFFIAVIVYGIIASLFTSTVHAVVDEELYVALAKSFHYKGRFEVDGSIVDYNCVLYSMLISLAYYVYSPERILFLMRLIGIISMCSAVFPIYFLSQKVLEDNRSAIIFSGMTLILPYMFDGMYLMQEVLSYPLFLWTVYFLYMTHEKLNVTKGGIWLVLCAVFSVLCFFTKTYLFFIPVVVNGCCFLGMFGSSAKERNNVLSNLFIYDMIYLLCTAFLYFLIRNINGGIEGSSHYATQFSGLFPISVRTFISGGICCIVYYSLLFLNMGVFPFGGLIFNRSKLSGRNRFLRDFCLIACIVLVLEIVFLIVLTEEGVPTIPHKFLFRYFQVLVPPILIIFIKLLDEQDFLNNKVMWLLTGSCFAVCICYLVCMQGKTRQAIADGYLYLTLENAAKHVLPYIDVAAVALLGAGTVFAIIRMCNGTTGVIKKVFRIGVVGIVLFWILNCVQLPVYTNIVADGRTIQSDSIKIAHYLNGVDCDLYYLTVPGVNDAAYLRNFYGYVNQTYQVINMEELEQIIGRGEGDNVLILVSSRYESDIEGMDKVSLDTERLSVYMLSFS